MNKNSKQLFISIALMIAGLGLIFVLSNFLEARRPALPDGFEDEDLALQGAKLKGFSLGFEGLIADWYWMQSLQYIGGKLAKTDQDINLENLRPLNPRLLYPLLENATELDPQFMTAYSYGAMVLPAIDPAQAIKISEKGIANNPGEWRLYQHLGYIYWRLGDYGKASEIYETGAKINGAPTFMRMMAARMKTQGDSRETARAIYRQMIVETDDKSVRETAEIRLLELDFLDQRDALNTELTSFKQKNGRCANNWNEILPLLKTVKLSGNNEFRLDKSNNLVDPGGTPYLLDKQNCEVRLNPQETKIPLK